MERSGSFIRLQHSETLVPLLELPSEYRKEIARGVSTGWKCIDTYLQGIRPGEVTVVTADTGVGKTTFCTQLMFNCAEQGEKVAINSWEMRPESMQRKIASLVLRKPMKLKNFTPEDNLIFDAWCKKHKVFLNPKTVGTTIEILAEQLELAKAMGINIVMLDHLDYLVKANRANLHECIDETVRRLHELAFDLAMHILLICHPKQSSTSTDEVGIHSLKGSSSIKQYADNVLILHRCSRTDPKSDPSKVKIRIAKNRMFGTEGTAYLFYQSEWDGYLGFNEFTKKETNYG